MYPTKKMFNDLKCDFKRYIHFFEYPGPESLSNWKKIIVLLKSPSIFAIAVHRFGFWINNRYKENRNHPMKYILKFYYHIGKYLTVIFLKIMIHESAEIEPGLFLSNKGNIILGPRKMGKGCTVHHNVTIGLGIKNIPPEIGDYVRIGTNSIVFGAINVGSGTIIESSTVLSKTTPKRCLVSGNPGRILKRNIVNTSAIGNSPHVTYDVRP